MPAMHYHKLQNNSKVRYGQHAEINRRITGTASWSCSLADFRACVIFFNEELNLTFFMAAMHSDNPSVADVDGAISSSISFSTKFGCT